MRNSASTFHSMPTIEPRRSSSDASAPSDQDPPPIAIVPDEILHHIFLLVAGEAWDNRGTTATLSWDDIPCLAISLVCRYWRRFALASPRLWCYLSITLHSSVEQLEAFIERSQDRPLFVKYTGSAYIVKPDSSWGRKGIVLVDQSHRLAEFHVAELRSEDVTALLSFFRKPAPLLRRLSLHAPVQLHGPSMFSRDLPSLRDIELSGILLRWIPYRDMDTMVLKDQFTPSLGRLLLTLKDCPKLRVLKLGLLGAMDSAAVLGGMSSSGDPQPEAVHLPFLQEFSLSSLVAHDIVAVLRYLTFPKTTAVDLKFFGHQNIPLTLARDCPSLGAIATAQESIILELIGALEWSAHIVLRTPDNKLQMEWEWYEAGGLPDILDTAGFSAISLPALKHLSIVANSFRLREAQWLQILAPVPTVRTLALDVRNSMVLELFSALSCTPEAESTDGPVQLPICPEMTDLKLTHLDGPLTILRGLVDSVEKRALHGYPLLSIEIISQAGKPLFEEICPRLRRCVGVVNVKHDDHYPTGYEPLLAHLDG
ncbi:hypothetical protein DAEQUDRAFT_269291 [Daedalea quercina L-15889]|uniref:Uncharacterized protein n=1 Tax=Daedalea quercina L-15889 TaxID=1314783 RepID=A0A165QBA5_9APHY|nr:hypothetical protein DAEQUDRAFT_269291 [Daedalea quercina L-15889]